MSAATLTLNALHVEGTVPERGAPPIGLGTHAADGGRTQGGFKLDTLTVSGVDVRKPGLAMVTPGQITRGRYPSGSTEQCAAKL
jgi:hypothetical protein